jgi:exodeoxyribonuclease-1
MNGFTSFYWHDYETFGIDPCRDRPAQFAGQRTNRDLEPIGDPLAIYCKPARDVLPNPISCLITGITPQRAERDGVIEAEFAARIHEELAEPGTCAVGFNSIRFDDEFTRNLLYRNFYDPYAREWENGNSRWDVIDLARMCYALRPQGIEWPLREDGTPSFRLEDLTAANNIGHQQAHDALSDVNATLAIARLLRTKQPRLFAWYFALRRKQRAFEMLDHVHRTPVLHVSSRYPAERGCIAMVAPLAVHPLQPNKVIVYDLDTDPAALLELDAEDIADRVFVSRADLPEGVERIPLKAVSANRSPSIPRAFASIRIAASRT